MRLTVATWNINSVRMRIENVRRFVETYRPDVLCLQETKAEDQVFPLEAITAMGYEHSFVHGMKAYNGVAILSRLPIDRSASVGWCGKQDCRHAIATVAGVEFHNLYIPSGGDIPDPAVNPKFAHKLQFLAETTEYFAGLDKSKPMVLVGDLNVAPLEHDVWSHKQLLDVVSHTPIEVEHLGRLQATLDWVDVVRHFVPADQKVYSWWSYRAKDWELSDRGRRLDHVWVTPPLKAGLGRWEIVKEARGWEKASDHVPVLVELEA